ncbi:MAG: hypothetical protein ACKN89_16285 [Cyanobium sp.]|nr:hypothetical protein [Synechococcaceae cyanobacterium]
MRNRPTALAGSGTAGGAGCVPLALAGGLGLLLSLLAPLPGRADSVTAESIWDRQHARLQALAQLPRGARVTRQSCLEIGISIGDFRYRCTVWYTMPPTGPTEPPAQPLP